MSKLFTIIGIVWFCITVLAMSYTLTVGVIEDKVIAHTAFVSVVILYLFLGYILRYKLIYRS